MDLLAGLNAQQLAAVTLPPVPALILAGAGSGKTRVLTTRIAWLLQTQQCSTAGILAVTFTNKAAKEMRVRLSSMVYFQPHSIWIGTFHGLCHRLLRTHYQEAGLPNSFQILDQSDQLSAIKRLLKFLQIDIEKYPPKVVQHFINEQKEQGLRAHAVPAHDPFSRRLVEIYLAYEAQCQREGMLDFAELLLRSTELLQRNQALREHYQTRFQHILVDEFQDTNRLQYTWLKLLAGEKGRIFAVGDDDQSIYAFRGANVGNMHDFQREYQIDGLIRLEQNYRSQGNILDAANAVISQNAGRLGKNLWTDAGAGEKLRLYLAQNDKEEAQFMLQEVQALQRDGVPLDHMAILYRSNAQSRLFEHALFQAGLAYRVYGGLRFFDRQEIKHALAYLRLAANPEDDHAFFRVINTPTRGIGARSLEQLQQNAQQAGCSLWQALCAAGATGRTGAAFQQFYRIICNLQTIMQQHPLPEAIPLLVKESGLYALYAADKEGQERLENLAELASAAQTFVEDGENGSALNDFLAHTALESGERQAGEGEIALQMMTVHAAKGLEFHYVFLMGLEEGLFPHINSINELAGVEEERRLMYVAMTRARLRLYLCHAEERCLYGQTQRAKASRFLEEIPEEYLQQTLTRRAVKSPMMVSKPYFPPKNLPNPTKNTSTWRIGQTYRHSKFGEGILIKIEGQGEETNLQLNFGVAVGIKTLRASLAKLETV